MTAPDPILRWRPITIPVSARDRSSTGPYPVTTTCTTLGDTRPASSSTEALQSPSSVGEAGGRVALCADADDAMSTEADHSCASATRRFKNTGMPFEMEDCGLSRDPD